jgi:SAM-dependent methyltransferase
VPESKDIMKPSAILRDWRNRLLGLRRPSGTSTEEWRAGAHIWESLARSDPLWAVLSEPDKRARKWNVEAFLKTGEEQVEAVLRRSKAAGARLGRGLAVDFGCGVGRLSRALSRRFDKVIGIDVSQTMVAIARDLNRDRPGLSFHLNQRDDLGFLPDGCADFVCSYITLQHVRPALAERYIGELFRIARPGGHIFFQIPSHLVATEAGKHLPADQCRAELAILSAPGVLGPGSVGLVDVRVRNAGPAAWRERLSVGNHWRDGEGKVMAFDDGRSILPLLDRGEAADIALTVSAPGRPGLYRLEVDVVQEGVRWFADVGSPTCSVPVKVEAGVREEFGAHLPLAIASNINPTYAPAPLFEMHGVPRRRVEEIAAASGMRLIHLEDHLSDWIAYGYYFEKLPSAC